jgi:hypothetical protein
MGRRSLHKMTKSSISAPTTFYHTPTKYVKWNVWIRRQPSIHVLLSKEQRLKRALNHMRQSGIHSNQVPLVVVREILIPMVVDEVGVDNQRFVLSVQFQLLSQCTIVVKVMLKDCDFSEISD